MKTKDEIISSLKKALEELDITSSLRLSIIQAIEYLQEEPVSEDRTSYDVGFYEGYKKCKQQMMKDAVKVSVNGNDDGWLTLGYLPECECELRKGDEVKVIIIKED